MKFLRKITGLMMNVIMISALLSISVYAGKDDVTCEICRSKSYYSRQIDNTALKNWMKMLPDDVQISQINLPATHDSGCWKMKYMEKYSQTQAGNIYKQLNRGIRMLDVRLATFDDNKDPLEMKLHHSMNEKYITRSMCYDDDDNQLSLRRVMNYIDKFLEENPSETVILYMTDHAYECDKTQELFKKMRETYRADREYHPGEAYNRFLYYKHGDIVPVLGEVRGKCVMIDDPSNCMTTYENEYHKIGLKEKYNRITKVLRDSGKQNFSRMTKDKFVSEGYGTNNPGNPQVKYVTISYNDAPFDMTPYECAPQVNTHFGEHVILGKGEADWQNGRRYGWIAMDYANYGSATQVIHNIVYSNLGTRTFKVTIDTSSVEKQ